MHGSLLAVTPSGTLHRPLDSDDGNAMVLIVLAQAGPCESYGEVHARITEAGDRLVHAELYLPEPATPEQLQLLEIPQSGEASSIASASDSRPSAR